MLPLSSVTVMLTPLDSEMGWTGEVWLNANPSNGKIRETIFLPAKTKYYQNFHILGQKREFKIFLLDF